MASKTKVNLYLPTKPLGHSLHDLYFLPEDVFSQLGALNSWLKFLAKFLNKLCISQVCSETHRPNKDENFI